MNLGSKHLVILNWSIVVISWYHISRWGFYHDETIFHISILGELGVTKSWKKLFIVGPLPCIHNILLVHGRMVIHSSEITMVN
jgi:hypothetical protein